MILIVENGNPEGKIITGVKEGMIETVENPLKQLLSNIHPRISYHLITDMIDGEDYAKQLLEKYSISDWN